jgi:hypothetical protein
MSTSRTTPAAGPGRPGRRARLLAVLAAAGLLAGCQSFKLTMLGRDGKSEAVAAAPAPPAAPAVPSRYTFRLPPYSFLSDVELQPDAPVFRDLAKLRDQVYKELQLPPGNAVVQVYLFDSKERYEAFMQARYPGLPARRAFFVAQARTLGGPEDLMVYTAWGGNTQQDLRHELTHALLHSVLKDVPLWLDEGLAEYFELPPESQGVNPSHLEQLRGGNGMGGLFKPDLARLEALGEVKSMNRPEYREAWAWAHLLLRTTPEAKAVLTAYLQQLRTTPNPGPLRPRLLDALPDPEAAFEGHLAALDPGPTARR